LGRTAICGLSMHRSAQCRQPAYKMDWNVDAFQALSATEALVLGTNCNLCLQRAPWGITSQPVWKSMRMWLNRAKHSLEVHRLNPSWPHAPQVNRAASTTTCGTCVSLAFDIIETRRMRRGSRNLGFQLDHPLYANSSEFAPHAWRALLPLTVVKPPWAMANLVLRCAGLLNILALMASLAYATCSSIAAFSVLPI